MRDDAGAPPRRCGAQPDPTQGRCELERLVERLIDEHGFEAVAQCLHDLKAARRTRNKRPRGRPRGPAREDLPLLKTAAGVWRNRGGAVWPTLCKIGRNESNARRLYSRLRARAPWDGDAFLEHDIGDFHAAAWCTVLARVAAKTEGTELVSFIAELRLPRSSLMWLAEAIIAILLVHERRQRSGLFDAADAATSVTRIWDEIGVEFPKITGAIMCGRDRRPSDDDVLSLLAGAYKSNAIDWMGSFKRFPFPDWVPCLLEVLMIFTACPDFQSGVRVYTCTRKVTGSRSSTEIYSAPEPPLFLR